jgi:hypothetical protein
MKGSLMFSVLNPLESLVIDLSFSFTERYFEMSHVDAEDALKLYRRFCKQTEYVVEFIGVAKKLQNILNVPVPNLKHVRRVPLLPTCY